MTECPSHRASREPSDAASESVIESWPRQEIPRLTLPSQWKRTSWCPQSTSSSCPVGSRFLHHVGRQLCPQQNGIFQIEIDGTDWIVLSDPDFNKQVLASPDQFTSPFHLFSAHDETDCSVLNRQEVRSEPGIRTLRSRYFEVVGRELSREKLQAQHIPAACKIFRSDLRNLRDQIGLQNTPMNMVEFYRRTTLRICSIILLGTDLTENNRWDKVGRALSLSGGRPNSRRKFKPFTQNRGNRKTMKVLVRSIDELIDTRKMKRARDTLKEEPQDLLDALLAVSTVADNGEQLCSCPAEVLRDALLGALSHSYNSTASMLSWATYLLFDPALGFQEVRHGVQQEVDRRERKPPISSSQYISSTPVTFDESLLVATLQETLRLHSPVPGLLRQCTTTTTMGGYVIPAGSFVILSIQGTHLHECWEDPLQFDPNRFLRPPQPPPFSYIPWSMGGRSCASGLDFALPMARMILKGLLSDFHVRLESQNLNKNPSSSFLYPESLMGTLNVRESHPPVLRREHERTSLQVSSLTLRSHRNSLSYSAFEANRGPGLTTKFTGRDGENSPTRAWASILSTIQRKEYPVFIAAGTNNADGRVMDAAYWFSEKISALSFNLGSSPFCLNDMLSVLNGLDSPELLVMGICVATYQGKPSKNAEAFVTWLNRCRTDLQRGNLGLRTSLRHLHYFVFSVEQSEWKGDFEQVGKTIDEVLFLLGAQRLCDLKSYDVDQDDLHETCSEVFLKMVPPLLSYLPEIGNKKLRNLELPNIISNLTETVRMKSTSSLCMEVVEGGEGKSFFSLVESPAPVYLVNIQAINPHNPRRSSSPTPLDGPSVSEGNIVSLDLVVDRVPDMPYVPGDSILIYPVIAPEIVQEVITFFPQYTVDTVVKWSSPTGSSTQAKTLPLGVTMKLGSILSYLVNVLAIPSRQFLMNLSTLVKNSAHMTTLEQHSQNAANYARWLKDNPNIRILDLLNMYHVREDALEQLLQSLPALRPQSYPIYTSFKYHEESMGIYVVDTPANNATLQHLLHMHQRKANDTERKLYISLQPGQILSLSSAVVHSDRTPCVIVSKGRSVAPFISLLYEAAYLKLNVRCYFFHCVGEEEGKRFVLRKALRKLKRLNMIEMLTVTHSTDLVQQLRANQANIWTFIHQLKSPIYLGGCRSTFRAQVLDELSQTIKNHCIPLVFRNNALYAEAFIELLREQQLFKEVWY